LGDRIDEDMVAVRLTPPLKGCYFASPAYFARHGRPRRPRDLLRHNCIRYRFIDSKRIGEWQFQGPAGPQTVTVKGNLIVNSFAAVVAAARDGLGIGWSLRAGVQEELNAGLVESVLDRFVPVRPGFYLYYPKENARIEILRLFADFMRVGRD
jgi:DNA-binding transcriptional LysR family regulator